MGNLITSVLVLVVLWLIGLLCLKKPTTVVRFLSSHINVDNPTKQLTKSQQIAKHVREHPDTWPQQFPELYRRIQIIGFAANVIFVLALFIVFMSWLAPITP